MNKLDLTLQYAGCWCLMNDDGDVLGSAPETDIAALSQLGEGYEEYALIYVEHFPLTEDEKEVWDMADLDWKRTPRLMRQSMDEADWCRGYVEAMRLMRLANRVAEYVGYRS